MRHEGKKNLSFLLLFLISNLLAFPLFSLAISPEAAHEIGLKIWKNECGGSVDGLTHWNQGEDFGSFGIGHFIWYPEGKKERFEETFPELLAFLRGQGIAIPPLLAQAKGCPWHSRDEFYRQIKSPKMAALRQFLLDTADQQALFIAWRFEKNFNKNIEGLPSEDRMKVKATFEKLSQDPRGLYALIDYSNFKGMGTSPSEAYSGQGWGLLQVLMLIPASSKNPLSDFVQAAKKLLEQRVQNAPSERNEQRWLKGWHNRIDTYTAIGMKSRFFLSRKLHLEVI